MAKRFTDTNKYRKPFMRGLSGAYKLLWDFLYHDCDYAGIWIVDFDIAQLYIGKDMPIKKEDGLSFFNSGEIRIIELDEGRKWFIPSFIDFQYGNLSEKNNAHAGILKILKKYDLLDDHFKIKPLTSPSQATKEKDKELGIRIKKENTGEKKTFNTNPISSDFNGLPENYVTNSIELVKITAQSDIDEKIVIDMWNIFKNQKLTGSEYYANEGKVYSHFLDWIKKQKFLNGTTHQQPNGVTKHNASALELLRKGKEQFANITGKQGSNS